MAQILLIVSGGIAAYKAPEIVREFKKAGHDVRVVMTQAAHAFVSALSLASVSGHPVRSQILDASEEGTIGHIELADWPDLIVIAPATAHLLARAAHGLADDLASTILLATRAPILWAPAMNVQMWGHPRTKSNAASLVKIGHHFVGPDRGELACGWIGEGRMIDPSIIARRASELLLGAQRWRGRHVVVSAGPTRAYLDPVRFISNASTGAMGFALAEAAAAQGAEVTLVAGPVHLPTPRGVTRVDVETADQMFTALDAALSRGAELLAMTAAVSDLRPLRPATDKLDKHELLAAGSDGPVWMLERDLVAALCQQYGAKTRVLAFAAQTVDDAFLDDPAHAQVPRAVADGEPRAVARSVNAELLALGAEKLRKKGAHAIFVNRVGVPGVGFASATNTGLLLVHRADGDKGATMISEPAGIGNAHAAELAEAAASMDLALFDAGEVMPKSELAAWLLDRLDAYAVEARWWAAT